VESKEDSQKSDKKASIGKQSNPLVMCSKPKIREAATKKIEIENPEVKVGQKRKYDQIKNIAQDIENKQKDAVAESKKGEKLLVNNQIKTEEELSKKRQKTKETQ
jgi:hypothetical protein